MAPIISFGFRNPFRANNRPGTNEVWVCDVGKDDWEEINQVVIGEVSNHGYVWWLFFPPDDDLS